MVFKSKQHILEYEREYYNMEYLGSRKEFNYYTGDERDINRAIEDKKFEPLHKLNLNELTSLLPYWIETTLKERDYSVRILRFEIEKAKKKRGKK